MHQKNKKQENELHNKAIVVVLKICCTSVVSRVFCNYDFLVLLK